MKPTIQDILYFLAVSALVAAIIAAIIACPAYAEDRTPQQQMNDRLAVILGIAPPATGENPALSRYLDSETSKNYAERKLIIGEIADRQMQYQPPTADDGMQRAIRESLIESSLGRR